MRWRRAVFLLLACSMAVTLCTAFYLYSSPSPTQDVDAQFALLPPIVELSDPQNNGFRRIAHFGAKVEDINKNNDFWKRSVKQPEPAIVNAQVFGAVDYHGGGNDNAYPTRSPGAKVRDNDGDKTLELLAQKMALNISGKSRPERLEDIGNLNEVVVQEKSDVLVTRRSVAENFLAPNYAEKYPHKDAEVAFAGKQDSELNSVNKEPALILPTIEAIYPVKKNIQLSKTENKLAIKPESQPVKGDTYPQKKNRNGSSISLIQQLASDKNIYPLKVKQQAEDSQHQPPQKIRVLPTESVIGRNTIGSDDEFKSPFFKMPRTEGENIVAMSLYGNDMRYTMGAIRNAELIKQNFPGWKLRIYTETPSEHSRWGSVPQTVLSKLRDLDVQINFMEPGEDFIPPMMWRFLIADDMWVDRFIIRDSDARLIDRDAAAVHAWVKSDTPFNCVRDHPSHAAYAISGGMWGGQPQKLRNILRRSWKQMMRGVRTDYLQDMNFLNYVIWPKVQKHAYCSDSVSCDQWPGAHPFPVPRLGYEHVGQVLNHQDLGRPDDIQILRNAGENQKCVPKESVRDLFKQKQTLIEPQ